MSDTSAVFPPNSDTLAAPAPDPIHTLLQPDDLERGSSAGNNQLAPRPGSAALLHDPSEDEHASDDDDHTSQLLQATPTRRERLLPSSSSCDKPKKFPEDDRRDGEGGEDDDPGLRHDPHSPAASPPATRSGRFLYQVFPGGSAFCCGGAFVTGGDSECPVTRNLSCPHLGVLLLTIGLPLIIGIPSTGSIFRYHADAAWLTGVFWFIFFTSLILMVGAAYTDPGIIPRREIILQTGVREALKRRLGFDCLGHGKPRGVPEADVIDMVPLELRHRGYRWCKWCLIIRPPRAAHCMDCHNCVLKLDHHCPFLNNCIGQRNYRFFCGWVSMLLFLAVTTVWIGVQGLDAKNRDGDNSGGEAGKTVIIVVAIVIGILMLFVVALGSYHVWLNCTGKTTREHLKGLEVEDLEDDVRCCGPRGAKLLDPRAWIGRPSKLHRPSLLSIKSETSSRSSTQFSYAEAPPHYFCPEAETSNNFGGVVEAPRQVS